MFTQTRSDVRRAVWLAILAAALALGAGPATATERGRGGHDDGSVYTQTQDPSGNEVVVYRRARDGRLTEQGRVATGGVGAAATPPFGFPILDSQGGIALTGDGLLFAVNAGDNTVSAFKVHPHGGLRLVDRKPSGGQLPVSVDSSGKLLYVLNELSGNISGFRVNGGGKITPIAGSSEPLSTPGANGVAGQLGFTPNGRFVTVTQRGPSVIDTFAILRDGTPAAAQPHPAIGQTPFGFAYRDDRTLLVANAGAVGDPADPTKFHGSASSYRLTGPGNLAPIGDLATGQRATCWVVVSEDGRYAFMTNTLSASVSRFRVGSSGALTLLGDTPTGPGFPADEALSGDGRYLHVLVPALFAASHVDTYRVDGGELTHIGSTPNDLPGGVSGLAAR